jgi:hypothetical protein
MASKKGSSKKSAAAASTASTTATSTATSTPAVTPAATQADPQKQAMFTCIQSAFASQGITTITSPLDQIVWTSIAQPVKIDIATALRACIKKSLGVDPGGLAGPILALSAHQPVMTVSTLIDDLLPLLQQ